MGRMLVSREGRRFTTIDAPKVRTGRFLTTGAGWLVEPVLEFLRATGAREVVDPFAGDGHLLAHLAEAGFELPMLGYDIAPTAAFARNDSLRRIPAHPDAVIVTNPPYLAKHSASRKRVLRSVARYYEGGDTDLYQVAIRRSLEAAPHLVALVPETFLHARVLRERLARVVVIERAAPFSDTTCPILVACFGPDEGAPGDVEVWRDDELLGSLAQLDAIRRVPLGSDTIRFNVADGNIALQAVDGVDPKIRIGFLPRATSAYDVAGIKHSSRLVTFLSVDGVEDDARVARLVAAANERIAHLRSGLGELSLSAFKGNSRAGVRRRRLDYRQARAILTDALAEID
jgi:hypothetical protein